MKILVIYKMEKHQRQYTVTVLPDNEGEPFSLSSCNCPECRAIHLASQEWDSYVPETRLQLRMKDVIKRIEERVKKEK